MSKEAKAQKHQEQFILLRDTAGRLASQNQNIFTGYISVTPLVIIYIYIFSVSGRMFSRNRYHGYYTVYVHAKFGGKETFIYIFFPTDLT